MPFAEWWLKKWSPTGSDPNVITVQIDPAEVWGCRGAFGPMLVLPYKFSKGEGSSALRELLSLAGWIGLGNVTESDARLPIPSQIVWPAPHQYRLQVPMTDVHIEAIEEVRQGGQVHLVVWLGGVASGDQGLQAVQSTSSSPISIERERWLTILQRLGAGARRLVELPEPRLRRGEQHWAECMRLLDEATRFYQSGGYEHALINCRSVVEGIPRVLCAVWGLTLQGGRFRERAQSLRDQLNAAWPEDRWTPETLQLLLTGAWHWLAPTPHYGMDIPLREEAAFVLGFCTDLLHFAGQVLQAHPDLIVRQREETA